MKNLDSDWLVLLFCGLAGGLIGYGFYGTTQAACLGAGIGLIALPVLFLVVILFGG